MTYTYSNAQPMPPITLESIRDACAEVERIRVENERNLRRLLDEIQRLGLDPRWRAEFEQALTEAGYQVRDAFWDPNLLLCWRSHP